MHRRNSLTIGSCSWRTCVQQEAEEANEAPVPKLTVFAQALSDHFAHGIPAPRYERYSLLCSLLYRLQTQRDP